MPSRKAILQWHSLFDGVWQRKHEIPAKTTYSQVQSDEGEESQDARLYFPLGKPIKPNRFLLRFCVLIFALNLLGLAIIIHLQLRLGSGRLAEKRTVFPNKEYETRIFDVQDIMPSPETDAIWDADMPKARGSAMIDRPHQFELPPGLPFDGGFNRYGVSWGHQYHCLRMLRDEFWAQLQNRSELVGMQIDLTKEHFTPEEATLMHRAHCYDYLRQVIVCHMDMTLEYPTGKSVKSGTIDGYGVPHQCVKRNPLDEYMIEHAPAGYVTDPINKGHHSH